jgi:O-antigen/teichoic acid export membrane protein
MNDFVLRTFTKLVAFCYERIFHEEMSDEAKKFFSNFSYVGVGTIGSMIFFFLFNILAARALGPSGCGTFAIIQSVAMFLYIPMLLGFCTAMIKYNAEKEEYDRQQSILSTTYALVSIFTTISVMVYYTFSSQISKLFSVSKELFYLAIIYAAIYVFYTLTTGTLRSLHKMKTYATFLPVYSIILLLAFLIFIFINFISFEAMAFSMYLAYGITGGLILINIRKYLKFSLEISWADRLWRYGAYSIIGGLSSAFYLNIDKILINKYMAVTDVGIYWAYSYSITGVMILLTSIFVTVIFPFASKCKDKSIIFIKINRILPYFIILGLVVSIGSGFIIFKLYGSEYYFDLKLALLCGMAGMCISIDSVYGWLMNAVGIQGVKITSIAATILAIVNMILNIWLIPLIGIEGAIVATIVSYILSIGIVVSKRKYLYSQEIS